MSPRITRRIRHGAGRQPPRKQRGMALLVAVLLVALGTIIAATIAYENAMTARRGAATLSFDQAVLIQQGAEAFAAYGLREIRSSNSSGQNQMIYIGQAWSQPYGPFEFVPGTTVELSMDDLQGRFNLNTLVNPTDGKPNTEALAAFTNLLTLLNIEPKWADLIVDWIDYDSIPMTDGAEDSVYLGQNPPYLTANTYITSTSELLALPGFGAERYKKLAPYITALPIDNTTINVCTAPGAVLDAFIGSGHVSFSLDQGQELAKNRAAAGTCFPTLNQYAQSFTGGNMSDDVKKMFGQNSSWFRLNSFVTIGSTEFNLYSLLYLDGQNKVRPILRSYTPD